MRIAVVDTSHKKTALGKAGVAGKGSADLSGSDYTDVPLVPEAEDLTKAAREFGDRIAKAPLTKRPEEGEILSNLGRGSPAELGEVVTRGCEHSARPDFLEEAEVNGEPANC